MCENGPTWAGSGEAAGAILAKWASGLCDAMSVAGPAGAFYRGAMECGG